MHRHGLKYRKSGKPTGKPSIFVRAQPPILVIKSMYSSLLVRAKFCPMKINRKSGLTLYPGYWIVKESNIWNNQKLTLFAKRFMSLDLTSGLECTG